VHTTATKPPGPLFRVSEPPASEKEETTQSKSAHSRVVKILLLVRRLPLLPSNSAVKVLNFAGMFFNRFSTAPKARLASSQ
jgi:hypothetical protein